MKNSNQQAIYALSGDPWTKGHEQVLNYAREKYGSVLIGIANATGKDYTFPALWERTRLTQASLPDVDPTNIRVIPQSLAHYMMRQEIPVLVRGVRNIVDKTYEKTLEFYYRNEFPEIEIDRLHIAPDSLCSEISSSRVKDSLKVGHNISNFVSLRVKQALESRLVEQYPIGVSGEMGSGKSHISKKLVEIAHSYGISCTHIDFDAITHDIYSISLVDPIYVNAREKIRATFGDEVMTKDGGVDRSKLGKVFLENPTTKALLENILQKPVQLRYKDILFGKKGIILVDYALLVEFELTHLVNHHVVLVQTDIRTRKARVIERYSKSGRTMSENDIDIMFSKQSNTQEKQRELEKKIQENRNGSSLVFNNSENTPDIRKVFFSVLNSVDISGELRTRFILKKLGFSDMESIAFYAELKKIHEELHRFYHTWEHIIELLTYLFDYAIQEDLTDD